VASDGHVTYFRASETRVYQSCIKGSFSAKPAFFGAVVAQEITRAEYDTLVVLKNQRLIAEGREPRGYTQPYHSWVLNAAIEPPAPKSWAPEVIADGSGKFVGNRLRFATREEAEANVQNLSWRWLCVRETRVVESDEPVTHRWDAAKGLVGLDEGKGA
jgi:hypothetical protein